MVVSRGARIRAASWSGAHHSHLAAPGNHDSRKERWEL